MPICVAVQVILYILYLQIGFIIICSVLYVLLSAGLIVNTVLVPLRGLPLNPQATKEAEKTLDKALSILETYWLKDGPFLLGRSQPSIADINLVCEVMELEVTI